jgi:NADPH-dependent F420 reductase
MSKPVIAILGGTGDLGGGLALRWAKAGYPIVIGSRSAESGARAAAALKDRFPACDARGMENGAAAAAGDIVVLTVPWANHGPMLEVMKPHVAGKLVIDVTVPLQPPRVRTVHLPPSGSAAQATQAALGEDVRVVSAFQNVAADHLADLDHEIDCDVLVCGNDVDSRSQVVELAEAAGMKAWHAGQLANSVVAEALTSVLIFMNNRYGIPGAGIRITGTPTK